MNYFILIFKKIFTQTFTLLIKCILHKIILKKRLFGNEKSVDVVVSTKLISLGTA